MFRFISSPDTCLVKKENTMLGEVDLNKNLSKNKDSKYQDYDAVIIIGEDYLEFE